MREALSLGFGARFSRNRADDAEMKLLGRGCGRPVDRAVVPLNSLLIVWKFGRLKLKFTRNLFSLFACVAKWLRRGSKLGLALNLEASDVKRRMM